MTQGRREDKCAVCPRREKRAGGAERGRAHAPPLSLRGRSDGASVSSCPVILSVTDVVVPATATATATVLSFSCCLILTTAVLSCLPGAPSAPGCPAASGRQARPDRQLLAHLPVSAEPAGAVSGCRYGPDA